MYRAFRVRTGDLPIQTPATMKTSRHPSFKSRYGNSARCALATVIAAGLPVFQAQAADRIKANNTTALNLAGSWDTLPDAGGNDVAVWNSTVLAANAVALGADLSWLGLRIANPGGAVTINNTANTLTLGSSGIDMSAAAQNLTINTSLISGAAQTWNLNSGRTLNLFTVNTSKGVSGAGDITLARTGAGAATVVMLPGANGSTGFNDGTSNNTFSGNWNIGAGVTVQNIRNGRTAWGTGSINLNGGTIAQIQGNWTWTNAIALGTGTTSTIANSSTGSNRSLKLQGVISGDGSLTFADTTGTMGNTLGFIITGTNTMSGTVTIPASRLVRVGGVGGDNAATTAGTGGTLGTAAVANNGTLTLSHSDAWTFGNSVSGSGALSVGNTGITGTATQDVTLTGANSYSGATTIANGTARIGAGGITGSLGSGAVTNNGALSFNRSDALAVPNNISGSGTLAQDGPGTTTLSGTLSYGGTTSVNAGRLNVNTTLTSSAITVGAATLGGNGTLGAVAVNAGGAIEAGNVNVGNMSVGTLTFGAGVTALRATAGAGGAIVAVTTSNGLTLNGTTTLNVGGVSLSVGSDYTLVDYVGAIGGNGYAGFALGSLPSRVLGNLVDNVGNTSVDFHVSALDKPKWTGATDGTWDITTINWKEITSTSSTAYIQGDDVLFDGTATGTTNVVLNSTVAPAAVTVDSSTLVYALTGTGKISGTTALTKSGSTTFTLGNTGGNDYAGATTIGGGTLKLGATNALPTAGSVSVAAGATLDLGGFAGQVGELTGSGGVTNSGGGAATLTVANGANITFGGVIADGTGATALVKSGAGTLTLTNANSATGGTTISAGKLALGDGGASGALVGPVTNNATLESNRSDTFTLANDVSGTGAFAQAGSGTTVLTGANSYGATTITAGTLQVGNGGTIGTLGSGVVSIGGGAALVHNRSDANTLANAISGAGAFRKTGAGALTVSGNNSFTGGAIIDAGTLVYGHANALGNSGTLSAGFTLRGGAVDFNGQSNYNPGPAHASGSLPNAVLLINGQAITLGGAAGATTLQDSSGLGFGSFYATPAGSTNTSILYDATNAPGTATLSAKILSTGTSGLFTRAIVVGDSAATLTEIDITGQMGAAPDGTGGFGDGKRTTIKKDGAGTLRISAANYFPKLQISAGTLVVNNLLALGQTKTDVPAARGAAGDANLVTVDGGTLDLNGFSPSIGGLSDGGNFNGIVTNNQGTPSTLTVGTSNASTTFSGALADGASKVGLTKVGAGTLTLSGANAHSGGTVISAGVLSVIDGAGNTNADTALGIATAGVTIDTGAMLRAGGNLATTMRTITLGTGGGIIDTNGYTVNIGAGSTVTGTSLTKTGAGTQTYTTLTASAGTTHLESALGTGTSTLNADAIVNIGTSQTLAALNIGAGGMVTFGSAPAPSPAFGEADPLAAQFGAQPSAASVPEPGTLSLLLPGILGLLRRPRRLARRTS